ncbi:3348_t:CDS:2, partial [Gigaspora rosea]
MNIQTSRPTKNSPYALVFEQNPLRHFMLLKKIKERHINSEDDLPENWFESSEPQDDFDQQKIVESLLGAAALNVEEQQLLGLVDEKLENEQVDSNEMVDDYERVEDDERVDDDERVNDEKVDNKRVDDDE